MRNSGGGRFVDQPAVDESLQLERLGQRMALARGKHVRKRPATRGNCLEAAGSPTAIDVQAGDGSRSDDGTGIMHYVDDARPLSQQLQAAERREQGEHCGDDGLLDGEASTLGIR